MTDPFKRKVGGTTSPTADEPNAEKAEPQEAAKAPATEEPAPPPEKPRAEKKTAKAEKAKDAPTKYILVSSPKSQIFHLFGNRVKEVTGDDIRAVGFRPEACAEIGWVVEKKG